MILLTLVWVVVATLEGLLYADRPPAGLRIRMYGIAAISVIALVNSGLLLAYDWRLWSLPALLELYRFVNAIRFLRQRFTLPQLNSVTLRAHSWLVSLQVVSFAVAGGLLLASGDVVIAIVAAVQLGCALLLLRSSLHTWRHSHMYDASGQLADRALPSVSILVPARNETDSLQRCLERLVASDYQKLEILVLDDNSNNRRTPQIIRSFAHSGVRFIQGASPDEVHWLAKNQAYERLRSEASGELLLFCGVDVLVEPESLRRLVSLLQSRGKDMVSVLPLKDPSIRTSLSLLQPMRYYWELCLPRRVFKRPPVLSTCWLIRSDVLDRAGGFQAVSRSMTPEAYFARQAVVTDAYSFITSDADLAIRSAKPIEDQYDTSVRMRYPQLHRRIELVALTSVAELLVLLGPIIGLSVCGLLAHTLAYGAIWAVCTACLLVTYYLAAVETKLNAPWAAWLLMPFAFAGDIVVQHISLYKYEFSRVEWKSRDVGMSVMGMLQPPQTHRADKRLDA